MFAATSDVAGQAATVGAMRPSRKTSEEAGEGFIRNTTSATAPLVGRRISQLMRTGQPLDLEGKLEKRVESKDGDSNPPASSDGTATADR